MRKLVVIAGLCMALPLAAQDKPQGPQPKPAAVPTLEKPGMAAPDPKSEKPAKPAVSKASNPESGKTVEEIIARVNNEIITRSEYDKARQTAAEDAKSECENRCTPDQLQTDIEDRQKNTLRELVDQALLVQRAKDMGVSVEPELIKRLDAIRTQNKLASMEELETAVKSSGVNFEDFKNGIRNNLLTQRVISSEVGSHINVSDDEVAKYYEAHKAEFVRPEQVGLREIVVSTEGKKPEELPDLKKKAETALKRVQDGEDFGEIAKRLSDGRLTEVMETKQGFLVLQVLEHYDEGEQSLAKVKNEISDKIYGQRMEPAMREYLKTLREQSYVVIKPGYQDIAGGGSSEIQEVSATPEVNKHKKGHKKFLLFGKRSGSASTSS